eukprot:4487512-Amphidinium_carterae.1
MQHPSVQHGRMDIARTQASQGATPSWEWLAAVQGLWNAQTFHWHSGKPYITSRGRDIPSPQLSCLPYETT